MVEARPVIQWPERQGGGKSRVERGCHVERRHEAHVVGHGVVAVVLAREHTAVRVKRFHVVAGAQLVRQVHRQPHHMALCRHGVERRIVALREERKLVLQPHVHVDTQPRAVFESTHHMSGATFRAFEPADIAAIAAAT